MIEQTYNHDSYKNAINCISLISFQTLTSNMVMAALDMTFEFNWIKDSVIENMSDVTEVNTTRII